MPDLFEPLRDLDEGAPLNPLAASEVRRRGDRMRRRRWGLQALGASAAVAVVVSGAFLTTSSIDDGTRPDPAPVAPAPEGGWRQEIPRNHALDRGYPDARPPETTQVGPSQKFARFTKAGIEPCGASGYPSAFPVDSLGTEFNGPEDSRARELTLYADARTASAVVAKLAATWQACPTQTLADPPFELTTSLTPGSLGDESWTVVEGAGSAPQLQLFNVVRVGNAVLINWIYNEGSFDGSADHVAEQDAQTRALAADMCIFALEPCPDALDSGPDISPKVPRLGDEFLLTADDLDQVDGLDVTWEEIANREDPTLDCQSDWLHNLGAAKASFREWSAAGAEAATAVLEFSELTAAFQAYARVQEMVAECDSPLPGVRRVSEPGSSERGSSGHGPMLFRAFATKGTQTWLDHQGVALTGSRVVLLSIAHRTDSTDVGEATPLDEALRIAADRATVVQTLGPTGIGSIELGMSRAELEATAAVELETPDGCSGFYPVGATWKDGFLGYVSDSGVQTIAGRPDLVTPEGIGVGAVLAEVRAAYPDGRRESSGWYAAVPGNPDAEWFFAIEQDDRVVGFDLRRADQTCIG